MNRFLSRHSGSVRLVEADGEHHLLDVFQASKFLSTVLKFCDQDTGVVTLEPDANPRHLTYFERNNLVDADKFDQESYRPARRQKKTRPASA